MDSKSLLLLERAFEAEINGAINGGMRMMQTRATKRAEKLVADGFLEKVEQREGMFVFRGYELTHAGRLYYCATCTDDVEDHPQ